MKIGIEANLYRYLFKNVYFINGTAYAGKSTMVRMLSEAFDGIECGENYHDALLAGLDEKDIQIVHSLVTHLREKNS